MNRIAFITGCVALLASAACSSSNNNHKTPPPTDAGTAGTDAGARADAGGKDSGAENDGGFANVTCDPKGTGVCQNAKDCPMVQSGKARESASTCGIGCLGNADEAMCAQTCVVKDTGLSSGCAQCYVGIVTCSRQNCLSQCLANPDSNDCFQCQVTAGCRKTFDDCSGLPPPK